MAFNIFGALGALGRLLPGYMQGERQAWQDNWQDVFNLEQGRQAQMGSLMQAATFEPSVANVYYQTLMNRMMAEQAEQAHPFQLAALRAGGPLLGPLAGWQNAGMLRNAVQLAQGGGALGGGWPGAAMTPDEYTTFYNQYWGGAQQPQANPIDLPSTTQG